MGPMHDSQNLGGLLDTGNTCNDVFADGAYRSAKMKIQIQGQWLQQMRFIDAVGATIRCL